MERNKNDTKYYLILNEHCDDTLIYNGIYFYEQNKTAKYILQISNSTLENKLKYIPTNHRIIQNNKIYISQDVIIKNLRETNQLFVLPILEKLDFIKRKTVYNTRKLGSNIPFSRIVEYDEMKTLNENGNYVKGIRDELLFLDSIVFTLKSQGLDWPGNLKFQYTKIVNGYRYDLYIKCSKICIEYNEHKPHHTSDVGKIHDDEKTRITNSEGYLLLNFDQTKKGEDYKQSTLNFISELLPIVRKRRHIYDYVTKDNDLYLDYLEFNGINKAHAKLMQDISLHKNNFTLTLLNAMRLMKMNLDNENDINIVLDLIEKLDDDIWKNEIDGNLTNNQSNLNIDNIRLNHRGFVKVAILVNTKFSHEILDYYMKIDELCSKLFSDIRQEQKEWALRIENNKNSYKAKLENQQMVEKKIVDSIKRNKDNEIENMKSLIKSNVEELKSNKTYIKIFKSLTDKEVNDLPIKLRKFVKQFKSKTLLKKKYEEIEDGDMLFEEIPYLVYSKFSDDYITFKKLKEIWNAGILFRKKKINTYNELKEKFTIFEKYSNIDIEIEEFETNTAHNIDNNQITNVRWREINFEDESSDNESEHIEESDDSDELELANDSDNES